MWNISIRRTDTGGAKVERVWALCGREWVNACYSEVDADVRRSALSSVFRPDIPVSGDFTYCSSVAIVQLPEDMARRLVRPSTTEFCAAFGKSGTSPGDGPPVPLPTAVAPRPAPVPSSGYQVPTPGPVPIASTGYPPAPAPYTPPAPAPYTPPAPAPYTPPAPAPYTPPAPTPYTPPAPAPYTPPRPDPVAVAPVPTPRPVPRPVSDEFALEEAEAASLGRLTEHSGDDDKKGRKKKKDEAAEQPVVFEGRYMIIDIEALPEDE